MTYRESIDWLYSTQTFGIKLGLENPTRLLREYLAFPRHGTKVIQVAGTNGKGSTCVFLESLSRACGQKTGLFTSPHLVSYRERIRIGNFLISEGKVATHLTELRELVADWENHPTFFELTLALAMRYFYDQQCDVIVLEVGMGGRFDATTAVPADATVLCPIALDHQQWLGETLVEIAGEKAAICREGSPMISAPQLPDAAKVVAQTANQTRSPLTVVSEPLLGFPVGLKGAHQAYNAALAVEALHALGFIMSYEAVKDGLERARHDGRFEVLEKEGKTYVLDISHNPHAVEALVKTWALEFSGKKPHLIFGAAESKDISKMLEQLKTVAASITFTPINSPRSTPVKDLQKALGETDVSVTTANSLTEALASVGTDAPILVTGSAFLVGEAKSLLTKEEAPLPSAQ